MCCVSFATDLLQAGYDISTFRNCSDMPMCTTMIYTHVLNKGVEGRAAAGRSLTARRAGGKQNFARDR